MLFIVKRQNGTIDVVKVTKTKYTKTSMMHEFKEPIRITQEDESVLIGDHDPLLMSFIPDDRRNELALFIDNGVGTKDFMDWLEGNGVAKYLVETVLANDDFGRILFSAMQL